MTSRVYIVDDDADARSALARLLRTQGIEVRLYPSAEAFLADAGEMEHGCLVIDVRLPQMTGPQLQRLLNARSIRLPVIFLSAHADVSTAVNVLREGAFHFLEKPIDPNQLIDCIRAALGDEAERERIAAHLRRLRLRAGQLTGRERDVMTLVVKGLSNKEIGSRLGISYRTVEIHRGRVMKKMHAPTFLALIDFVKTLRDAGEQTEPLETPQTAGIDASLVLREDSNA